MGYLPKPSDDESELWSMVSDLFGATTLIFLVLFILAAALVGDPIMKNVRAELEAVKKQNAQLILEVERLKKEEEKYKKNVEAVLTLSAAPWAVVMKADVADQQTSRFELMVMDPLGGRITTSVDHSVMLSNRGASWISAGAEQIVAQDDAAVQAGGVYPGIYRVFLIYQKGNSKRDKIHFRLGKKNAAGAMEVVHQAVIELNSIQAVEASQRVFQFEVDERGQISGIKKF